MFTVTLRRMQ